MPSQAVFWDKIAPKYAKSAIADEAAYNYTLERTRSYLTSSDKVLELGCGTGSTALLLAPSVGAMVATDISPGMIAIAQQKTDDAGLQNMSCQVASNVPDGNFDVILGFNLFHLMPDMEQCFADIYERLPSGGYFISKTPCLKQPGGGAKGMLMRSAIAVMIPAMQLVGKAPYVRRFSIQTYEAAIEQAGFSIVESSNHPNGPPPRRYIVARKP